MVIEIMIYKVKPGREAQALALLNDQAVLKRRQEGCRDARVLSASRSVASPSTDPELILSLAEFDGAASYAAYREVAEEEEKKAGKPPLAELQAAPPTVGIFE